MSAETRERSESCKGVEELGDEERALLASLKAELADELAAAVQEEDIVGDYRLLRFLRGFNVRSPAPDGCEPAAARLG